ncbi:PD-(D/E)XK nuclease family protein [Peribacillus deserti]|nr:PD-(D/E)XK nuclease family protein [Peribacillus deserti]
MKTLFKRVYDLLKNTETHRIEDYLTEIFSPILKSEEKLKSFLNRFINDNYEEVSNVQIFTQRTYSKLEGHSVDSRPDMVINYTGGTKKHILFIENKVGSQEGENQLSRYADHLKVHQSKGYNVYLLYLTKYYEPKEDEYILDNGSGFTQKRWYEVYNWLSQYKKDLYCRQVIEYMEELQLNKTRKFTPIDIYAIQNAQRLQSMLDECLDGRVMDKFTELFGKPKQWSHRTTQLRANNLYILINDQTDWKFVGCGFEFTEEEYPSLTVFIEVHPNCNKKDATIAALNLFCENKEEWTFQPPSDDNEYFWCYTEKNLVQFLPEEDHIMGIQNYLIARLQEVHQIKVDNPQLVWI